MGDRPDNLASAGPTRGVQLETKHPVWSGRARRLAQADSDTWLHGSGRSARALPKPGELGAGSKHGGATEARSELRLEMMHEQLLICTPAVKSI